MRTEGGVEVQTIAAAQAGDPQAKEELVADCLPLVYNIVGRALNGHADVDDVVQETLLRVLDGLDGLREPNRFRSWLAAIAMNEVRRRWSSAVRRPAGPLDDNREIPDPAADFVDLTILRLGLSGQRREIVEATRWLEPEDREVLALWWLEACGRLSRAELSDALTLSPQHAAVRVQRTKERLEAGRVIVRALSAQSRCPELSALTASWDGNPSAIWRKRLIRHTRDCATCSSHRKGLAPAEALLAGLLLVPPPPGLHAAHQAGAALSKSTAATLFSGPKRTLSKGAAAKGLTVVVAAGVIGGAVWWAVQPPGHPRPLSPPRPSQTSQAPAPAVQNQSPQPTPTPSADPSPTPARTSAGPRRTVEQQVVALVNAQRAQHGCGPLRADPALHTAAQRHSDEMAARRTLAHTSADGDPGGRITAAGYDWSAWGENIAQGQSGPSSVMSSWMNSPGHRANILNCGYQAIGVGVSYGPGGPWWTQDFASPR